MAKSTYLIDCTYNGEQGTLKVSTSPANMEPPGSRRQRWQPSTKMYVRSNINPKDLVVGALPKPPYSLKGDDPAVDKQWRQYNKAELRIQKDLIEMARVLVPQCTVPTDYTWSRTCGCSCSCSPGYRTKLNIPQNLYISFTSHKRKEQAEAEYHTRNLATFQAKEAATLESMVI